MNLPPFIIGIIYTFYGYSYYNRYKNPFVSLIIRLFFLSILFSKLLIPDRLPLFYYFLDLPPHIKPDSYDPSYVNSSTKSLKKIISSKDELSLSSVD